MIIIPAIDLHDGKCVRLYQGDLSKKTVYSSNPAQTAKQWQDCGAKLIHVVDLDGAFKGSPQNMETIKKITSMVSIPIQVGGGIRTMKNCTDLFDAGVSSLIVGTSAYEHPDLLKEMSMKYPDRIMLGVDAKNMKVAIKGWVNITHITVPDIIGQFKDLPIKGIIYTDIKRDGTLDGPNLEALEQVAGLSPFPVIASGGISTEDDIKNLVNIPNIYAVILGKSLYSGAIDLKHAIQIFS